MALTRENLLWLNPEMNRVGPMENWDHFMDRRPKEISNAVIMIYISWVTSLSETKVGKAICGAHLRF